MPKREKARTFVENENDKHCMFNFMLYFVLKSQKKFFFIPCDYDNVHYIIFSYAYE